LIFVIVHIPAPEKVFVVIACNIIAKWGNCLHVIFPMILKEAMIAASKALSHSIRKGVRGFKVVRSCRSK
jgi:hypothetical protein